MLLGAFYGGILGPATGGFLLALFDRVKSAGVSAEFRIQGELWFFPFVAVVSAGLPGAAVGAIGAPRLGNNVYRRAATGALLGLITVVLALIVTSTREVSSLSEFMKDFGAAWEFYVPALLSGMLCAVLFPSTWASPVNPSVH